MEIKISVIVPIYNIEAYIEKCVYSILNQTYTNLEVILVDDGSTDSSGRLCDKFAEMDTRIKVIHKENGGLSDARNKGMEIISGEFISFVDGDDFIDSQMLKRLLELSQMEAADIAIANVRQIYRDFVYELPNSSPWICSGREAVKQHLQGNRKYQFYNAVWNKLYTASCIRDLRFPKGRNYEDICFTIEAYLRSTKVVCAGETFYNYVVERPGSIMNAGIKSEQAFSAVENCEMRTERLKRYGDRELVELSLSNYLNQLLLSYYRIDSSVYIREKKEYKLTIRKKIYEVCKECKKNRKLWIKAFLIYGMFFCSPKFCCMVAGHRLKRIRTRLKRDGYCESNGRIGESDVSVRII